MAERPRPVAVAAFLGEAVLHDVRTGRLFQLNPTAAKVWRSLCAGECEGAIVGDLALSHGADSAAVRRDVEVYVDALRTAGLLGPSEVVERYDAAEPRAAPALDAAYRVGEVTIRVVCYPPDVAAGFAPLAAPAMVPDGAVVQSRLAVFRHRDAFVLTYDDRFIEAADGAPAARWAMVRQLVSAARHGPLLALLHAGAVATPAGSVLLCGESGAGKSTLLAGLVHAGCAFVADDIVPVQQGAGLVWPVRLAISIKRNSWRLIGALFPQLAGAPIVRFAGRTMRYLWPVTGAVAGDPGGHSVAAVLFPKYAKDAPTTLIRLDPLRALALLGEGGSVLPPTDTGLAEFLAWWSRLPVYQLVYGRLADAVQEVCALTDRLLGSAASAMPAGPGCRAQA